MKLTPLDIHHKEFRHSIRGYSEEEVDTFLDEVADEFERLFKENIDQSERLEAAQNKVRQYQDQEETIRNTMVTAQRSAEDISSRAREEASTLLRDAEVKAKEIIHTALAQKQKVQGELIRIKQAEEEFRARFKSMLDGHSASIAEVTLPEDVTVLIGETNEGVVADVDVAPQSAVDAAESIPPVVPIVEPASIAEPVPDPELMAEPPAPGFVQGVVLGETVAPDIDLGQPDLGGAKEFAVGSFADLGERDAIDIEEID